jgi:hypothetical protein
MRAQVIPPEADKQFLRGQGGALRHVWTFETHLLGSKGQKDQGQAGQVD